MEKIFFSRNNYNRVFEIVKENIAKKHNIDISSNEQFSKEIINIMKMVYTNRNNFNFPANMPPMIITGVNNGSIPCLNAPALSDNEALCSLFG